MNEKDAETVSNLQSENKNDKPDAAQPVAQAEEPKKLVLPILDVPQVMVDFSSGMFWVGIPIGKNSLVRSLCVLDASKAQLYDFYAKTAKIVHLEKPSGNGFYNQALQNTKRFLFRK